MKCLLRSLGVFGFVVIFFSMAGLRAQTFELHPYAGGALGPSSINSGSSSFELKNQGIFGIRADFFVTRRIELGGNFAYLNHFEFENSDWNSRGYLWEANGNYRFDLEKFKPFLGVSVGGITVDRDPVTVQVVPPVPLLDNRATFLTFSYGGGIKAPAIWGPVGLRTDIRGRTLPNLLGESSTWLEMTGGLTFTF